MKRTIYKAFARGIMILFLIGTLPVWAQQSKRVITGTVFDTSGETMTGVTIVIPGTTMGTLSSSEGRFSISVPAGTRELQASFVGYKTEMIRLTARNDYRITMQTADNLLDSVVVVGYGQMRKSDVTGAVTSVSPNLVEASSSVSIQSLLQGRAAGVAVTSGDAAPGAAINIKIRGTGSLTGGSEPLYVVDGIIMNTSDDMPNGGQGSTQNNMAGQNGLTGISPQDIESMEILKDASATAIYGSLGANGVILITTKSGKSATPKISYMGSVTISDMVRKREMLNFEEYLDYQNTYCGANLDPTGKTGIDWQNDITRRAISQSHRISVAGKSDKTTYYIAGGYLDNQGIVANTSYSQSDVRLNLEQKISRYVTVGTRSSFMYTTTNMVQGSDTRAASNSGLIKQMLTYRPWISPTGVNDIDPNLPYDETQVGPRAWRDDFNDYAKDYRTLISLYANVKILPWLSSRTTFGMDYRDKTRQQWWGLSLFQGSNNGGIATVSSVSALRYNIDQMFNLNFRFGKHRLDATTGITAISTQNTKNLISVSQFDGNVDFKEEGMMFGTVIAGTNSNQVGRDKVNSFAALARVVYSYDDRYVLTSTFRADGVSKFAPGNKFSYFPSFAFAYRMNRESFLRDSRVITNLKWRVGWGQVGSQAIAAYQTLSNYGTRIYSDPWEGSQIGFTQSNMRNPDLKWETTTQTNIGLDLGLYSGRLNLTVDLYHKMSRDLLQVIDIPRSTGFSTMSINQGKIRNQGLEIALDMMPVATKKVTLSIGGNISFNRNKIVDIGVDPGTWGPYVMSAKLGSKIGSANYFNQQANIFIEGRPVALFWGYQVDGIVKQADYEQDQAARRQYQAEYLAAYGQELPLADCKGTMPTYKGNMLQPGDLLYRDINGNGEFDADDMTVIGDPNPKFTYGFTLDLSAAGFFMNAVFNGSYGNQIANGNRCSEEDLQRMGNFNITRDAYYGMWTPERGDAATYPRVGYNGSTSDFTSMIVEDGSFLRFSTLTLGYTFRFKKKKPVSALTLSVTGRNLFVWTDYSGYDPEVSTFTNDWSKVGVDWGSYPNSRSYIFSIGIDF